MIQEEAQIISDWVPGGDSGQVASKMDPVAQFTQLRREEIEHPSLADLARLQQMELLHSNPQLQALLRALDVSHLPGHGTVIPMTSIRQFFEEMPLEPSSAGLRSAPAGDAKSLAERSKGSPKLRKFVEEHWPEEGKEKRIQRATERVRSVTLGEGLSKEAVRFYAEELGLYDDF